MLTLTGGLWARGIGGGDALIHRADVRPHFQPWCHSPGAAWPPHSGDPLAFSPTPLLLPKAHFSRTPPDFPSNQDSLQFLSSAFDLCNSARACNQRRTKMERENASSECWSVSTSEALEELMMALMLFLFFTDISGTLNPTNYLIFSYITFKSWCCVMWQVQTVG